MIDVGEALAREQMAEYAEVSAALERGEELRRLTWAARASIALIVLGAVAWMIWSSLQPR
ncbi:hypothetical protein RKE29_14155 [Streptomyces sp. B1866]|uniref:hypothetical protein n=1 Tax=Streptomyces sp. B1866 TaxID=3075431 RepID=UPI00288D5470|nr:hypothetical protein [Streptomyces sp. B1866]MDT3397772.1 hypothetical protein [Streptomyces sp. B1866]